jgi:TonB-linked SusC/RagA family outer membrane protein
MQLTAIIHPHSSGGGLTRKMLRVMKITAILMLAVCLQVSARTAGQTVSLSVKDASMKFVFREIRKQTGLNVLVDESLLEKAGKITLNVHNMPVSEVLGLCLKNESFNYSVEGGAIVVKAPAVPVTTVQLPPAPPVDVHGRVTNEKGEPVAGATVTVAGTNRAVSTDGNGEFILKNVGKDATLVVSSTNLETSTVKLNGRTELPLSLKTKVNSLEDLVVIGYGSQKKASLTAAVTTVNTAEMTNIPTSSLSSMLAGRASGTFVQTPTGLPGGTSVVRIRASSSWNGGSPLFVIDGVVRDSSAFDALDPTEIANMSILKDAASAAIYGSRSSNGVVVVTTKTGGKGKPSVQLSSVFGVYSKPEVEMKYMSVDKAMDLYNQVHAGGTGLINDFDKNWIHANNPDGKMYFDAAYTNPFSQKHTLNVSGGGDNVSYFLGGSFFDQKGFLPNLKFQRYNLRANVSANLTKNLTLGLNLHSSNNESNRFYSSLASDADLSGFYEKLYYLGNGFIPPYINGKAVYPGWAGGNPIESMNNGGYNNVKDQKLDGLIALEYKVPFIKGLSLRVNYSHNNDNVLKKSFATKPLLYTFAKDPRSGNGQVLTDSITGSQLTGFPSQPFVGNDNIVVSSYQLNGGLTYDKNFGLHHINVMAAYEQYESKGTYSSIYKYNFPISTIDQFAFASQDPANTKATGYELQDGRLSYIGRINYDYGGKYLLSASAREDGSIKFAPNKRWGLFPSVSAGWVISRENFFAKSRSLQFIDQLKLRFSYGTTGNDAIGGWLWQELYHMSDSSFYVGGAPAPILTYGGLPNPNLTWESATSYNLGLDLNFLRNWNFTAELWKKHSYDILGSRILALPIEFGTSFPAVNYGIVDAKGMEFDLGYSNGKIGHDITFDAKLNFSVATTNVVEKDYGANSLPAENPNGKPLNYIVGYQAAGIIRDQQTLNNVPAGHTIFGAKPELGMMDFADVSGPGGKPDGIIDQYDKVVIAKYGSPTTAPISVGFNFNISYKGFTLSALFSALAGYKVLYNDPWSRNYPNSVTTGAYYDDSWSASNPNGRMPKLFNSGDPRANGYVVPSTFNIYSGNFMRLKNLNISYEIAQSILHKTGIKSISVFAGGTNLFIVRKFKYYDPEVYSNASYPNMTTVTTGVNLRF